MKSLHITNAWHESSGGVSTFYRALLQAANREGHRLRLVVPAEVDSTEEIGEFGRLYRVAAPRAPLNPEYRMLYPNRFLFPRTALHRILKHEQPDLVEVSEKYTAPYFAGLLRTGRLPGVDFRPTTVGVSHERMDENMSAYLTAHPLARRFCRWYMKAIYFPMFDHHITVSAHTAEELMESARGHKVRRGIWVLPMGVDSDLFSPDRRLAATRARLEFAARATPEHTILFYSGRLAPEKNPQLLLETMQQLDPRRFRLVVAGDGILFDELRAQCSREAIPHVTFLGHVKDRQLLAGYYASADIFVHPNPREPFGIAPLEAMASGTPLVAPDCGGVTTYANDSNAWLAEPDPGSFAEAIHAVLADPGERERRAREARRTAEAHHWNIVAARYLETYRAIHVFTQQAGGGTSIAPYAWSTPGDAFGRETGLFPTPQRGRSQR